MSINLESQIGKLKLVQMIDKKTPHLTALRRQYKALTQGVHLLDA
jgi:hypothetical protein